LLEILCQKVINSSDSCQFDLFAGIRKESQYCLCDDLEVLIDLPTLSQGKADRLQTLNHGYSMLLVRHVCFGFI